MNDDFARAVVQLDDDIDKAVYRAENAGMFMPEIVTELRRIADALSEED